MKKNKQEELYELIRSLSAADKKFIRWYLSKYRPGEENKLLLLFDLLNKSKMPDDEQIGQAYQHKKYSPSYLAADRNQLYETILLGLSELSAKSSQEIQLAQDLEKAIVLFEKKLFEQCLKQLTKTIKHAMTYELWGLTLSLLHLEQRCLKVLGRFDAVVKVLQIEQEVCQKQLQSNQLTNLHYQSIQLRIEFNKARSSEKIKAFDVLMDNPLLAKAKTFDSFYAQFHYWEAYCNYYFVKDDVKAEYDSNQQLLSLMKSYDWYWQDNPLNYIAIQTRLLAIQRRLNPEKFKKDLPAYRLLPKTLKKQKREAESNIFIFSYNFEIDQLLKEKQWKAAYELIAPIEKGLALYQQQLDEPWVLSAYYRMAYACFFKQDYNKALDYIVKVLNDFPPNIRPDIYSVAQLLQIAIHFELGNKQLMPYLINNTRYYLEKQQNLFKTEALVLSYLKKLSNKKIDKEAENKLFMSFEEELKVFALDNYEHKVFAVFNFLDWVSLKLSKDS